MGLPRCYRFYGNGALAVTAMSRSSRVRSAMGDMVHILKILPSPAALGNISSLNPANVTAR